MKRALTWLAAHPLPLLLPFQALLLFWHLSLLSPWFDEADTLLFMRGPLGPAIAIPASGLHPPLYFFVLWCWMRLPLGLAWIIQARTLSVLFTLGATFAVDRLWARHFSRRMRWCFLALWAFSPFLLLYGRMSRSYSLQLLIGATTVAAILRFEKQRSRRAFAVLTALLIVALYTHYVPGAALLAAANIALLRRGRWPDAAAIDALCALAMAPWMVWLIPQLQTWSSHHVSYALTGGAATEIVLKLAYWAMSFVLGEAIADPILVLGALVAPLTLLLALSGARRNGQLTLVAVTAAAVGFLGVTKWVAYPFIPARMIFFFPLFLTFVVQGAVSHRRLGWIAVLALMITSLSGIWCYFHLVGFRNKQYPLPMDQIAARIRATSGLQRPAILVDEGNSDIIGLRYALNDELPLSGTQDPRIPGAVSAWLTDPNVHTIWFLRNTHDVSPQGLDQQFEQRLSAGARVTRYYYERLTPLELRLMRALGMSNPPEYFHELIEFQR